MEDETQAPIPAPTQPKYGTKQDKKEDNPTTSKQSTNQPTPRKRNKKPSNKNQLDNEKPTKKPSNKNPNDDPNDDYYHYKKPNPRKRASPPTSRAIHDFGTFNRPTNGDTQLEVLRQHALNRAVHAMGGTTKLRLEPQDAHQFRAVLKDGGRSWQIATIENKELDCDGCNQILAQWEDFHTMKCSICGTQVARGADVQDDVLCSWRCWKHDTDVCLTCVPVVLQTVEARSKTQGLKQGG
jgi:DNA mismatch repair ATPase MutL